MNAVVNAKALSCRKGEQKGKKHAFGFFLLENNQTRALWDNSESFLSHKPEF